MCRNYNTHAVRLSRHGCSLRPKNKLNLQFYYLFIYLCGKNVVTKPRESRNAHTKIFPNEWDAKSFSNIWPKTNLKIQVTPQHETNSHAHSSHTYFFSLSRFINSSHATTTVVVELVVLWWRREGEPVTHINQFVWPTLCRNHCLLGVTG